MKYLAVIIFCFINLMLIAQAQYDAELVQAFHHDEIEYYVQDGDAFRYNFHFSAVAKNIGTDTLINVSAKVTLIQSGNLVHEFHSDSITLIPNQQETFDLDTFNYQSGDFQITFTVFAQGDTLLTNNEHVRNVSNGILFPMTSRSNQMYYGQWNSDTSNTSFNGFELGAIYRPSIDNCAKFVNVFIGDSTDIGALVYAAIYEKIDSTLDYLEGSADYTIQQSDLNEYINVPLNSLTHIAAGKDYLIVVGTYGGSEQLNIGYSNQHVPDSTAYYLDGSDNTWYTIDFCPLVNIIINNCFDNIDEYDSDLPIGIYPNPSSSIIQLDQSGQFQIQNLSGKIVFTGTVRENENIEISNLPQGMYFISVEDNNQRWLGKFIRE